MKAIVSRDRLALDSYCLDDVEMREPDRDEVRVRVHVAGVSFVDVLMACGGHQNRPALPYIPGSECAGVIEAVGPQGDQSRIGERVCVMPPGAAYAERVVVSASSALTIPDEMSFAEAAIVQVNYITAYHALAERARVAPDETVLVLGAGGGVGSASVQLARALGARVVASASSVEKRAAALSSGASAAIDSNPAGWRDAVREATDGHGPDIVIDPVCGNLFEPAFRSLAWGGRHMVVGFAAGTIPALSANLALLKGASLMGVESKQALDRDPGLRLRAMACVFDFFRTGLIRPRVGRLFALDEFAMAMEQASSGQSAGHIVVNLITD